MATTQVQVRIPKEMVREIDKWVAEGRFSSRSEAVKTMVALYNERENTRKFYQIISRRSEEVKRGAETLIPLDEVP